MSKPVRFAEALECIYPLFPTKGLAWDWLATKIRSRDIAFTYQDFESSQLYVNGDGEVETNGGCRLSQSEVNERIRNGICFNIVKGACGPVLAYNAVVSLEYFCDQTSDIPDMYSDGRMSLTIENYVFRDISIPQESLSFYINQSADVSPLYPPQINRVRTGRPPKYKWPNAIAFLIKVAETPDGIFGDLKPGAGKQAHIERLIAEWFHQQGDDVPVESEIRKHARIVMDALAGDPCAPARANTVL